MTSLAVRMSRLQVAHVLAIAAAVATATPVGAQSTPAANSSPGQAGARALSLADALRMAEAQSEAIEIARAGVDRAKGQELQARSQYLPQFSGTGSYARTLKSQFSVFQQKAPQIPAGTPPVPPTDPNTTYYQPCTRYLAPGGASQADQLSGLQQYALCTGTAGGGINLSKAGFGAANQYNLGVSGSLNVFTGGRVQAQVASANAGQRSAQIELTAQKAQTQLDVAQAYYNAVLADRLVLIADSTLVQSERTFRQTTLAKQVGNTSEFEMLRAQVQRDNQVPVLIQARTNRDLAYLHLKQLLNLPYEQSVSLADELGDSEAAVRQVALATPAAAGVAPEDTSADHRATVRELAESLRSQEAQERITRSQRLPSVQLTTAYGRVAFPANGVPNLSNFLTNWTVTLAATVPLYTGGRIRGEEMVARANVAEAKARLHQTRELAALDAQQALAQVAQAQASLAASQGTASQATRAYTIADVRYREGISTQLELAETRTELQQALANRAMAARDYKVAQLRLALLKDLPLTTTSSQQGQQQRSTGTTGGVGTQQGGAAGGAAGQQQQPPRSASASISPGSGQ